MKKLLRYFFPRKKDFWTALLVGIATAAFIYLAFLQRHFFSYRYFIYAVFIAGISTLVVGWLNRFFILPIWENVSKGIRTFTITISLFLTLILLLNIRIEPLYYILPDTDLEITFSIDPLLQDQEGVRLLWIETGQGYVPYTYLEYTGQWERVFGNTIFSPDQSVTLRWSGKVGREAEIAFRKTVYDQPITIVWNGVSQSGNLRGDPTQDAFFRENIDIPWFYFLPFALSFVIFSFYLLFCAFVIIGNWQIKPSQHSQPHMLSWLWYMLPMLLVWIFVLLILWPGILTNDSLTMWAMAASGRIDDWQSAFYTYLLSLLMRIVPSPGFVLMIQIAVFALVTAWGLTFLQKLRVPRIILWIISIIMAVFPPSILYVVTLWKDIPYAIALLAFTIAFFAITTSGGLWITRRYRWILLGVLAFLVGIFRHNGAPVALISLLFLPIFFHKQWKYYIGSILVALAIFLLVRGPLYDRITVEQESTGQSNLIYLHHIAAHLDAGTHLSNDEVDYLNQYLPIEEWDYNCCYVGDISYNSNFARAAFLSNTPLNRSLAIALFKRAPFVDLKHAFCAGEMAYQFMNDQQCWHTKSLHGFISTSPNQEDWIGNNNRADVTEASLFPSLVEPLILILRPFGIFDASLNFYLRPAFWLFVSVLSLSLLAIRRQSPHLLLTLLPIFGQSLLLFLIAFAPAFRYYYGNCIVGIFLLGCAFVPAENARRDLE